MKTIILKQLKQVKFLIEAMFFFLSVLVFYAFYNEKEKNFKKENIVFFLILSSNSFQNPVTEYFQKIIEFHHDVMFVLI